MYPSTVEFLRHIQSECDYLIKEYKATSFDEFTTNERLTKAICRSLESIGESVNKIRPDIKIQFNVVENEIPI